MRKSQELIRFPQSVQLFKFCLRVLEARKPNDRIHDQDLGSLLEYNPSDTSHWKRGKKSIRNLQTLETLSQSLEVDFEILQDLVEATSDLDEAWSDFLDAEEERRLHALPVEAKLERQRRRQLVENMANHLLSAGSIQSLPVHISEITPLFPFIQFIATEVPDRLARSSRIKPGFYAIRYRKGEVRPHVRLAIVREIARIVLLSEREQFKMEPLNENLLFAEMMEFVSALLVPRNSFLAELDKISPQLDVVRVLSRYFWVPRSLVRTRLSSLLMEKATSAVFEPEAMVLRPEYFQQDGSELTSRI